MKLQQAGAVGELSAAPPPHLKEAVAPSSVEGVIVVRGLEKSYVPGQPILRHLNLEIVRGDRVALVGANGSGKSTLLKCMIGLHPNSGGSVRVFGEEFAAKPSAQQRVVIRRQTGFVLQRPCLVARRSVLSNVIHGMLGDPGSWRGFTHQFGKAEWRERAMAALEDVNLADKALQRADSLSGGQQQRVAIARALVRKPQLLIADEPAASLDPAAGKDVMGLFNELCERHGITLLFTSHDMEHAVSFSSRLIVLKGGRLTHDLPSLDVTEDILSEAFR